MADNDFDIPANLTEYLLLEEFCDKDVPTIQIKGSVKNSIALFKDSRAALAARFKENGLQRNIYQVEWNGLHNYFKMRFTFAAAIQRNAEPSKVTRDKMALFRQRLREKFSLPDADQSGDAGLLKGLREGRIRDPVNWSTKKGKQVDPASPLSVNNAAQAPPKIAVPPVISAGTGPTFSTYIPRPVPVNLQLTPRPHRPHVLSDSSLPVTAHFSSRPSTSRNTAPPNTTGPSTFDLGSFTTPRPHPVVANNLVSPRLNGRALPTGNQRPGQTQGQTVVPVAQDEHLAEYEDIFGFSNLTATPGSFGTPGTLGFEGLSDFLVLNSLPGPGGLGYQALLDRAERTPVGLSSPPSGRKKRSASFDLDSSSPDATGSTLEPHAKKKQKMSEDVPPLAGCQIQIANAGATRGPSMTYSSPQSIDHKGSHCPLSISHQASSLSEVLNKYADYESTMNYLAEAQQYSKKVEETAKGSSSSASTGEAALGRPPLPPLSAIPITPGERKDFVEIACRVAADISNMTGDWCLRNPPWEKMSRLSHSEAEWNAWLK